MPARVLRILMAPVLASLVATPVHGGIYTWTDEEGVTHYTDQPRGEGAEEAAPGGLANSPMEMPEPGTWKPERDQEDDDGGAHEAAREREEAVQKRRCRRYEERLEWINEELGSGYREPRGNRLRADRRELRSKIFSEC